MMASSSLLPHRSTPGAVFVAAYTRFELFRFMTSRIACGHGAARLKAPLTGGLIVSSSRLDGVGCGVSQPFQQLHICELRLGEIRQVHLRRLRSPVCGTI
jgi:hypothetical protein